MPTIECLDAKVNALEEGHRGIDKRLDKIDGRFDDISDKLDSLVAMQNRFDGMEKLGRFLGSFLGAVGVVFGVLVGGVTIAKAVGWIKS